MSLLCTDTTHSVSNCAGYHIFIKKLIKPSINYVEKFPLEADNVNELNFNFFKFQANFSFKNVLSEKYGELLLFAKYFKYRFGNLDSV